MVDFSKLRRQQQQSIPLDPVEIFLRLPKSPGFDDLWSGQAEALRQWYQRRNERDIVIKLNTGGGKTLVGLLIAQSILNEHKGPVLYLCPTRQLQGQILEQSKRYGIPAVPYISGQELPEDFMAAKAVMVATYHALFNGYSKFGIFGGTGYVGLQGIIFDDAHTAFSNMREIFSLSIERNELNDLYEEFTSLFRGDFAAQNRLGTFDDVIAGQEYSILEVPYVAWATRAEEVRQRIAEIASNKFSFVWPLLRDSFKQCHALVSKDRFVITPLYPMVDLFPSVSGCSRRIYMSATVADDSSIIRTFDANYDSVSKPISPTSLAGVGERMILIPELMRLTGADIEKITKELATQVAADAGVVILAPSAQSAGSWSDVATVAHGDEVAPAVNSLVQRSKNGPFVFPNRYDGIDLPSDACRLLVLLGLPRGNNIYDLQRATVLEGSSTIDTTLAQQVEQGMGRGTRGGGDHCVVLLLGKDLVSWVSRASNLALLTNSTQAQLLLGMDVSREITSSAQLDETMHQCLDRAHEWTEFHANALADSTGLPLVDAKSLQIAAEERRYFNQVRSGYYAKATGIIEKFARETDGLDPGIRGWLFELGARAAHHCLQVSKREQLQREAYSHNKNLHRPTTETHYSPLSPPTEQALRVAAYVEGFALVRGTLADFESIVEFLVPSATSNQFEEALKNLGLILGFSADRPEKEQGVGPDVLWILDNKTAWTIEAKSKKLPNKSLTKEEHGQLLQATLWVEEHYKGLEQVGIIVHPNANATQSVTVGKTMALALPKLGEMVGSVRTLLQDLTSEPMTREAMVARCGSRLDALHLRPTDLGSHFLAPFVAQG